MLFLLVLLTLLSLSISINYSSSDGMISEFMSKSHPDVQIIKNEMEFDMAIEIVGHCLVVLENNSSTNKEKEISEFVEQEYSGTWLVFIDRDFSSNTTQHYSGLYIEFSYKNHTVIVMRSVLN